jgi:hypothetical protein
VEVNKVVGKVVGSEDSNMLDRLDRLDIVVETEPDPVHIVDMDTAEQEEIDGLNNPD